jgi:ParB-like chromosome segregation protein Spo0J
MEVVLVDMAWLKPHEEVQPHRVDELRSQFEKEGHVDVPLLVDRSTGTILDGHHRFTVGQVLGLHRMPALLFDYLDETRIAVDTWPGCGREHITKQEIIDLALRGERTPPKTSRHRIDVPIPTIEVALADLRDD